MAYVTGHDAGGGTIKFDAVAITDGDTLHLIALNATEWLAVGSPTGGWTVT